MIEVYSWATPNGHKVHIMLEECGLPYRVMPVDIGAGDQFKPAFIAISPNNKIPAIVDADGPDGKPISLFESGAILLYLAGKTGRFLPESVAARYEMLQWLMFQVGGVGPMLGQAHHFRVYAPEKIAYAVDRYTNEARRLYGVMDKRLAKSRYIGGKEYGIADMAIFPWPTPERLVRRDRRPPCRDPRRGRAHRTAPSARRRSEGARNAVRADAIRAPLNRPDRIAGCTDCP
jgi:GST-like protein